MLLLVICEGLARCGKSCRLRWINHLRPNVKRGNYTKEDEIILNIHAQLGNKYVYFFLIPNFTNKKDKFRISNFQYSLCHIGKVDLIFFFIYQTKLAMWVFNIFTSFFSFLFFFLLLQICNMVPMVRLSLINRYL